MSLKYDCSKDKVKKRFSMEQTGVSGRKEQKNAWQPTQPEVMTSLLQV